MKSFEGISCARGCTGWICCLLYVGEGSSFSLSLASSSDTILRHQDVCVAQNDVEEGAYLVAVEIHPITGRGDRADIYTALLFASAMRARHSWVHIVSTVKLCVGLCSETVHRLHVTQMCPES